MELCSKYSQVWLPWLNKTLPGSVLLHQHTVWSGKDSVCVHVAFLSLAHRDWGFHSLCSHTVCTRVPALSFASSLFLPTPPWSLPVPIPPFLQGAAPKPAAFWRKPVWLLWVSASAHLPLDPEFLLHWMLSLLVSSWSQFVGEWGGGSGPENARSGWGRKGGAIPNAPLSGEPKKMDRKWWLQSHKEESGGGDTKGLDQWVWTGLRLLVQKAVGDQESGTVVGLVAVAVNTKSLHLCSCD